MSMHAAGALWKVLNGGSKVVIVLYDDEQDKNTRLAEAEELVKPAATRTSDPEVAFGAAPGPVFITPEIGHEEDALATLAARREHLLERSAPVVLFLLEGGAAMNRLKSEPGLASWLGSAIVHPSVLETVDVATETRDFVHRTGHEPVRWLAEFRSGRIPDTLENNLLSHWATLLTGKP